MTSKLTRRMIMMILGNLFIGFGISLFITSSFGTDPFTTMNLGVSGFVGMSLGAYQLILNIVLLTFVWIYGRNFIGAGTIVNMVFIGFTADFFVYLFGIMGAGEPTLVARIALIFVGVIICSLAVAFYMTADLGIAPYDAMAFIIEKLTKNKIPFAAARVMTDVTCVAIGFGFGAIVGISTLITAFLTGPLVQYFRIQLAEPILHGEPFPKMGRLRKRIS
ncbi:YczE/YyaS/YitT family protein [Sediminibacillus massiliensis]|uniref:YczE/YyaS/YitT family protein n=1 Tax=Sediminibacillus massiliensis TaxID=1926277 RepID=UPI000988931C|nr:membrane protein [Sediminibacillus massiliensis]